MSPKAYELSKALAQVNAVMLCGMQASSICTTQLQHLTLVNSTLDAALAVQQLAEI